MPERATIFQTVQIGVETTYGTSVPALVKLTGLSIEPHAVPEVEMYRATGNKFPTVSALNKESGEADLSGPVTYTEIIYLLSSLFSTTTPTTQGTAKVWTFDIDTDGADNPKSFTVEQGSTVRAHKMTGGLVTGVTMEFDRDGAELTGSMIGRALLDGITLTPAPVDAALIPVMPTQVSLKTAATQAGLTAASALTRLLSCSWALTDRHAPLWALNGSADFTTTVEIEPTLEVSFRVEADSQGMAYLANLRAGDTVFVRIQGVGATIGAGPETLLLQIDTACKITDVTPFEDTDGVFAVEWTCRGVHDGTWGRATQIKVQNTIATL